MIKLKLLLENSEWAGGMFDYDIYCHLPPDEKLHMAITFIQSPYAKKLTGAEVFHIILTLIYFYFLKIILKVNSRSSLAIRHYIDLLKLIL